jgi:hypothetical protein
MDRTAPSGVSASRRTPAGSHHISDLRRSGPGRPRAGHHRVRLFGQLAWLVTFATVALRPDWGGAAYRIDLGDGKETFSDGLVVAA